MPNSDAMPVKSAPRGDGGEGGFCEVDGLRLHYVAWGPAQGRPWVMLHGIRLHAHVFADFARRYPGQRIIALDARGHGESEWREPYQLQSFYQDLRGMLSQLTSAPVTLIGHSFGGHTAMLYACLHPEEVERLVLIDIAARLPAALTAPAAKDFSRITETPPPQQFASPAEATRYLAGILKRAPQKVLSESVRHGLRRLDHGRYVWKYDPLLGGPPRPPAEGSTSWQLDQMAPQLTCPVLLVRGAESAVVPLEIAQWMEGHLPDCAVKSIPQAGHAPYTEQPAAFAEAVRSFLLASSAA